MSGHSVQYAAERAVAAAGRMRPVGENSISDLPASSTGASKSPATGLFSMNPVRQFAKLVCQSVLPRRNWLVRGSGPTVNGRPAITLTFDDGPDPEHTPDVLEALREFRATGTFFVIGHKAEGEPELLTAIHEQGHELANHSHWHRNPNEVDAQDLNEELLRTEDVLAKVRTAPKRLMRPPRGELTLGKLTQLVLGGWTVVLWNVDPKDYRCRREEELQEWCARYRPRHGDILLFHDNHRWASLAIRLLAERGIFEQFATVPASYWVTRQLAARPARPVVESTR